MMKHSPMQDDMFCWLAWSVRETLQMFCRHLRAIIVVLLAEGFITLLHTGSWFDALGFMVFTASLETTICCCAYLLHAEGGYSLQKSFTELNFLFFFLVIAGLMFMNPVSEVRNQRGMNSVGTKSITVQEEPVWTPHYRVSGH